MTKLEVGQQWYNTQHNNVQVTIVSIVEQGITVKSLTGFIYTYDYKQFLNEYTMKVPNGLYA